MATHWNTNTMKSRLSLVLFYLLTCRFPCSGSFLTGVVGPRRRSFLEEKADDKNDNQISNDVLSIDTSNAIRREDWSLKSFSELEEHISAADVGGAAMVAVSIALLQGGGVAVSGIVGLGAALLAVSEGLPGDSARLLGAAAWNVGRGVKMLSEDPSIITINSPFLEYNDEKKVNKQAYRYSEEARLLDLQEELKLAIYACYEVNNELESYQIESLQANGRFKLEMGMIEENLKQLMEEIEVQ